jgi:hypothetical protein
MIKVIDTRSGHIFTQDWDGQPFTLDGAVAFMDAHNRRIGSPVFLDDPARYGSQAFALVHPATVQSRGALIDGADFRVCPDCGQHRSAPIHTAYAA